MKTWQQFRRYHGSDSFYGCVAPDGTWFDSALLFSTAVHWCCMHAGLDALSPADEMEWMDNSDLTHGYSIIQSSLLERMYMEGIIK